MQTPHQPYSRLKRLAALSGIALLTTLTSGCYTPCQPYYRPAVTYVPAPAYYPVYAPVIVTAPRPVWQSWNQYQPVYAAPRPSWAYAHPCAYRQ